MNATTNAKRDWLRELEDQIMEAAGGGNASSNAEMSSRGEAREQAPPRAEDASAIEADPKTPEPVFPDWVMTGPAGEFAKLYSSYLEPPAVFFYFAYLACLGSIISNRLVLESEIKTPARLYVLLLGESADDRKSTALVKTIDFFSDDVEGFAVCRGVGSAEGLQSLFAERQQILLCLDEFRQFVSKCKIDGSVLLPLVNTLFETNSFEAHTKRTRIAVNGVGLSLLAASTIGTYEETWSQAFTDIGFNNRLFLVVGKGKRKFAFPREIPNADRFALRNGLREILRFVGAGRRIGITPEARELFEGWYFSRPGGVHAKRLDTYALRLMQLLAVNELKPGIDCEIVQRVISVCDWEFLVRKLNDPIGADNAIATLELGIRRQLEIRGALTEGKLRYLVHADRRGLYCFSMALENLSRAGLVTCSVAGKTRVWRLSAGGEGE